MLDQRVNRFLERFAVANQSGNVAKEDTFDGKVGDASNELG
jgi:hypothetical protein